MTSNPALPVSSRGLRRVSTFSRLGTTNRNVLCKPQPWPLVPSLALGLLTQWLFLSLWALTENQSSWQLKRSITYKPTGTSTVHPPNPESTECNCRPFRQAAVRARRMFLRVLLSALHCLWGPESKHLWWEVQSGRMCCAGEVTQTASPTSFLCGLLY